MVYNNNNNNNNNNKKKSYLLFPHHTDQSSCTCSRAQFRGFDFKPHGSVCKI